MRAPLNPFVGSACVTASLSTEPCSCSCAVCEVRRECLRRDVELVLRRAAVEGGRRLRGAGHDRRAQLCAWVRCGGSAARLWARAGAEADAMGRNLTCRYGQARSRVLPGGAERPRAQAGRGAKEARARPELGAGSGTNRCAGVRRLADPMHPHRCRRQPCHAAQERQRRPARYVRHMPCPPRPPSPPPPPPAARA